jgi:hypothetical protein
MENTIATQEKAKTLFFIAGTIFFLVIAYVYVKQIVKPDVD